MKADWRFELSPQAKLGLRSYAGTQIRMPLPNGEQVSLGTLCVASLTTQPALDEEQKASLVRIADVIMGEIVSKKRLERMQERQAMSERLTQLRAKAHAEYVETETLAELSSRYSNCLPLITNIQNGRLDLPSGDSIPWDSVQDGLWEDTYFIKQCIEAGKFQDGVKERKIRAAIARISPEGQAVVLSTSEMSCIFDDLDVWFVDQCAQIINTSAQARSLREALDAKNTFLRSVTHELRTPIHAILSSVELATESIKSRDHPDGAGGPPLDASSVGPFLETIRRSSTELMTTVNNILRLNAFVTDMKSFPTDYDLHAIETDVLDEIFANYTDDQLPALSVRFDNKIPTCCGTVKIDGNLLRELLKCLILNAIAATPSGSISVSIRLDDKGTSIVFDIKDTGIGIAEADQRRVFQAFEKVNPHSTGAGLGLNLASQMARTLDGRLFLVSSTMNEGSHFRVQIPYIQAKITKTPTRRWSSVNHRISSTYSMHLSSEKCSHLVEHLEQHLQLRNFEKTEGKEASLLVVNQPEPFQDNTAFLAGLDTPRVILYVCDKTPSKEVMKCLTDGYKPHMVYPVIGPLYSSRLDGMMLEIDLAFSAYMKAKKPQQDRLLEQTATATSIAPSKPDFSNLITPSQVSNMTTPPATPGTERVRPILTTSQSAPVIKALLVDDNKVNLSVLQMYCKRRKMPHGIAYDGNQAVSEFCRHNLSKPTSNGTDANEPSPYTVILMDLQMPECDGVEACRQIRRYEKEHDLSRSIIFILTGQDSVSDRKDAFEAGVDDYFVKPVSVKKLDQAIARYTPSSPK